MPNQTPRVHCPDCDNPSPAITRRDFVKTAAVGVAAASVGGVVLPASAASEAAKKMPRSETLVQQLYSTLSEKQRGEICFRFDHPLQSQIDNNWHITKQHIKDFFTPEQQDLTKQIFNSLHSEEYAEQVFKQVEHDASNHGGFGDVAVAMFGEPGTGKFEFVLTGRHVTRRCDGDSVQGAAFGGPIFYGHAAKSFNEDPNHEGNIYWYQAKRANQVFAALDGKQRKAALRQDPRRERRSDTVKLSGKREGLPGIPCSDLSADQKELVAKVLEDLLAPFRKADAKEAMKLIEHNGGIDSLSLAFYNNEGSDIGNDGVWDVWQVEGPNMVWFFRGAPHVHTWVHIRESA